MPSAGDRGDWPIFAWIGVLLVLAVGLIAALARAVLGWLP